jgi:hypothetical protein
MSYTPHICYKTRKQHSILLRVSLQVPSSPQQGQLQGAAVWGGAVRRGAHTGSTASRWEGCDLQVMSYRYPFQKGGVRPAVAGGQWPAALVRQAALKASGR